MQAYMLISPSFFSFDVSSFSFFFLSFFCVDGIRYWRTCLSRIQIYWFNGKISSVFIILTFLSLSFCFSFSLCLKAICISQRIKTGHCGHYQFHKSVICVSCPFFPQLCCRCVNRLSLLSQLLFLITIVVAAFVNILLPQMMSVTLVINNIWFLLFVIRCDLFSRY